MQPLQRLAQKTHLNQQIACIHEKNPFELKSLKNTFYINQIVMERFIITFGIKYNICDANFSEW